MSSVSAPRPSGLGRILDRVPFSFWMAILFFALFAMTVERFATTGNLFNIARIAAILGIVTCGQAIVLVLGGIEFSFASSVALSSVISVVLMPHIGVVPAFLAGMGTCLAIGLINATLIARFELPAFLVTLGTLMAGHGLAQVIAGGLPLDAPASEAFTWPARGEIAGVPVPIVAALLAVGILHVLLAHSLVGRYWYMTGGNIEAARTSGIKVRTVLFWGYVAAAGFCAAAAVILTSRVASGHPELWPTLSFETIAACAIGGIPLAGGQGRTAQVVCGVLIIAMMQNAVILLNLPNAYQQSVTAIVIIGAVLIPELKRRLPRRKREPLGASRTS
jgi:ribose/xylose/arabinose/galactoside ABC-type transport system permease subunit